jgi:gliding motility-associated-like protein
VLVKGEIKNFDFAIFNRNGEKVFETQDSDKCWDGNYKGKKALLGNYVYYFTAYTRCGKIVKKGNVILIR